MKSQLRVCFIGKMRSGKSEATKYLIEKFGEENVELVDFGDELKNIVGVLYPEERGKKIRPTLQKVGQHMRKLDENIWIKPVEHKINNSDKRIIVCASCRQQNEYDFLNKMGFLFVKIDCSDSLRIFRAEQSGDVFDLKDFTHETEMEIDNFTCDYSIWNGTNTKEVMRESLDRLFKVVMKEGI